MEAMASASPDEMAKGMEPWMEWAKRCGDALLDFGTPLIGGQKLTPDGASPVARGVVGYSILQAEDMAGATALMQGHPHLGWNAGCEIEIHESIPAPI